MCNISLSNNILISSSVFILPHYVICSFTLCISLWLLSIYADKREYTPQTAMHVQSSLQSVWGFEHDYCEGHD